MTIHLEDEQVAAALRAAGLDLVALEPDLKRDIERAMDDIFEHGYEAGYSDADEPCDTCDVRGVS